MPDLNDKYIDGGGYAYGLGKIFEHIDEKVESATSYLPTPQAYVTQPNGTKSATIALRNTYTGYGNVTVVWKKNSEPTASTDGTAISTAVTENGTYYVRAFAGADSYYKPSGAFRIEVTEIGIRRCWGVMWNTAQSSTKLTRLTPSNDPEGLVTETISTEPVSVDGASDSSGYSPFDGNTPWAEMRKRNISGTTLGAWEDEDGFSLSTSDVMVYLPKVYYLIKKVGAIWYYYIANEQLAGMTLHPGGGKYYGRYFTKSGYVSTTGGSYLSGTLTNHRTNAMAKGTGWHAGSSPERALVDLLYIIEYADWNSQEVIGHGDTSYSTSCGGTDALQYHTGHGTDHSTQYRNIENLWGYNEWLDGILFQSGQAYICTDYTKFASSITSDYITFGTKQTSPPQNSFITDFMYDEANSWLMFIANKGGGSNTTYVPDYTFIQTNSTVFAPYVGVSVNYSGSYCGLFFILVSNTPDGFSRASRLVFESAS